MFNNISKNESSHSSSSPSSSVFYDASFQKHLLIYKEEKIRRIMNVTLYTILIVTLVILGLAAFFGGFILATTYTTATIAPLIVGILINSLGFFTLRILRKATYFEMIPTKKNRLSREEIKASLSFYNSIRIDEAQNQEIEKTSSSPTPRKILLP